MKKSNWIVYIIALIISAFLLWLWYFLEFDHIDAPLDLVLSIVWWVLVAVACFSIHRVEKKRRERLRTCYVRKDMLYNSEAGTLALSTSDADNVFETMRSTLANLEYGFDIQGRPEDDNGNSLPFAFVVRSKKFKEKTKDDEQRNAADDIDWEGEVVMATRPNSAPIPFENPDELRSILRAMPQPA